LVPSCGVLNRDCERTLFLARKTVVYLLEAYCGC
jgi:hypothetical protein